MLGWSRPRAVVFPDLRHQRAWGRCAADGENQAVRRPRRRPTAAEPIGALLLEQLRENRINLWEAESCRILSLSLSAFRPVPFSSPGETPAPGDDFLRSERRGAQADT